MTDIPADTSTTAHINVGDTFVGPTPDAAGKVLADSKRVDGRGDSSFAFDLNRCPLKRRQ